LRNEENIMQSVGYRWIHVAESLPALGSTVLILSNRGQISMAKIIEMAKGDFYFHFLNAGRLITKVHVRSGEVIYWMPLPNPPTITFYEQITYLKPGDKIFASHNGITEHIYYVVAVHYSKIIVCEYNDAECKYYMYKVWEPNLEYYTYQLEFSPHEI
jgi:hypothetical protein